ncbi:cytochrome c oxidase subunit 3 family protein [Pseudoalteromonas sp. C2R02]|uniref:cytochrome c oxidase subunit 3 family protein n=1 Tax=Pseudoalteromonas sp. C2R02 TaxID=2841565 RepID=UPI002090CA6A|nr:cytochrome c oxidase subunit 3 family protein [Pseudoalteromonas sp. C2R02]
MQNEIDINTNDKKLPGDLAMWFFILAELTVFAILFIAFAVTKQLNPQMFISGQAHLHPIAGIINTLALITSSYFVALSVHAIKQSENTKAAQHLIIALLIACIYVCTKSWEYQVLIEAGFGISTNTFFMLYFLITFFHFMHVLLGMIILAFIAKKAANGVYKADQTSGFEAGGCYWHMVDLVWIILFPLIYILN